MTMKQLQGWLHRITQTETPPAGVIAFNIGLLQTEDGYAAYLTGAAAYDADDNDWACDEAFTPAERYHPLTLDTHQAKDWQSVQAAVTSEVKAFLVSPEGRASFLAAAQAVTVGFDDGELTRVA